MDDRRLAWLALAALAAWWLWRRREQRRRAEEEDAPISGAGAARNVYWFRNGTGKTIDLEARIRNARDQWERRMAPDAWRAVRPGEPDFFLQDAPSIKCDELGLTVYEFQRSRAEGFLYNWSPTCAELPPAPPAERWFEIVPDDPADRNRRYAVRPTRARP